MPSRPERRVARRVLVLRAGSGAANNLIRSLKAGDGTLHIVGCHDDRFVLAKSSADRNHLLPDFSQRSFPSALRQLIAVEQVEVVIPTSHVDVLRISSLRGSLGCATFLPRHSVIQRCQDKYALTVFLRGRGVPAPLTYPVRSLRDIDALFRRFASRSRLWCRIRKGTGSFGAIPVTSPAQARSWIRYFQEMRGVPPGSFTLSEYLPGRDFCVQCLWRSGELLLVKMAERMLYLDSGSPSGVSSTPALARTAYEPIVIEACTKAIRSLDRRASGVYFVDVKESAQGAPCITEINAGRFATITNIHDLAGNHNMAAVFVRLALGERVTAAGARDFARDYYLVRSVDTLPAVMHADRFLDRVRDTRDQEVLPGPRKAGGVILPAPRQRGVRGRVP